MKTHDNPVILVIEDERPLLEVIKQKLELSGFEVVTARTAEQAKEYIADIKTISAIWLDHYLLGKENGLDLLVGLKRDDETKHIPVFVVSNTASPDKIQSYLEMGAEKYYTKSDHRLEQIIADIKKVAA